MSRKSIFVGLLLSLQSFGSGTPTSPSAPAFVADPSGRGTVGLVFSCVLTMSLCVWSAIHMNAHRPSTSSWNRLKKKIYWASTALLIPEFVVVVALQQLLCARTLRDRRNSIARQSAADESSCPKPVPGEKLSQTDNGNEPELVHTNCPASESQNDRYQEWTMTHAYFALLGGFQLKMKPGSLARDWNDREANILKPWGILRLAELKMLPNDIPEKMIEARSKSDWLSKGLICFQVVWMMIQIIARKVGGLPVTLLELNTAVHIGCAIVLYLLWWYKPQDVTLLIVIDVSACERCKQTLAAENFKSHGVVSGMPNNVGQIDAAADDIRTRFSVLTTYAVVMSLSALYGGIHAIAWKAHFPSHQEQILWRVAACLVSGCGFLVFGSRFIAVLRGTENEKTLWFSIFYCSIMPYLFGRIFLLVEAFISVRSLPVGAYDTVNWVNFLPHIG